MPFLATILTYSTPSEAEVDKSLLEANGFTVNLLNAEVTRMQLGPGFNIQLQVPDDQVRDAVALLRSLRPERFGSAENVRTIERGLRRSAGRFALVCAAVAVVLFVVRRDVKPLEDRIMVALGEGLAVGALICLLWSFVKKKGRPGG